MNPLLVSPLALIVSLSTAAGIFLHDMHIDAAAATALSLPPIMASYDTSNKYMGFSPDFHTHMERSAVNELKPYTSRLAPRLAEDKKHFLQKRLTRGHHAFDNYNLPILPPIQAAK